VIAMARDLGLDARAVTMKWVNGVLREVELAALPDGTGQDGAAGGVQPGMVVADDEADAAHAAVDQAVEEGSPVDFGFRGIAGDAEHAPLPAAFSASADGVFVVLRLGFLAIAISNHTDIQAPS
jgi:hypothetical protein